MRTLCVVTTTTKPSIVILHIPLYIAAFMPPEQPCSSHICLAAHCIWDACTLAMQETESFKSNLSLKWQAYLLPSIVTNNIKYTMNTRPFGPAPEAGALDQLGHDTSHAEILNISTQVYTHV